MGERGRDQSTGLNLTGAVLALAGEQGVLLDVGDRVRHLKFGEGTVVEVTGSGSMSRIKIEFTAYGTKEFALATAPIVKLED